jgi:hypothetical protein
MPRIKKKLRTKKMQKMKNQQRKKKTEQQIKKKRKKKKLQIKKKTEQQIRKMIKLQIKKTTELVRIKNLNPKKKRTMPTLIKHRGQNAVLPMHHPEVLAVDLLLMPLQAWLPAQLGALELLLEQPQVVWPVMPQEKQRALVVE